MMASNCMKLELLKLHVYIEFFPTDHNEYIKTFGCHQVQWNVHMHDYVFSNEFSYVCLFHKNVYNSLLLYYSFYPGCSGCSDGCTNCLPLSTGPKKIERTKMLN